MTSTQTLTVSFVAKVIAKPDTTEEVSTFLADAVALANEEEQTVLWLALRTDDVTFWIFDAFASEEGRKAHIEGPIAAALMANAERLFASPPEILPADILASKVPG